MLKKRIIGLVIVKNNIVVQSRTFNSYLPIGSLDVTLQYLDDWGIDEIIVLDISSTQHGTTDVLDNMQSAIKNCFVPITLGGGLDSLKKVSRAFKNGADKVSFNKSFHTDNEVVGQTISEYGSQSCVISIDVIKHQGEHKIYKYWDQSVSDLKLEDLVNKAVSIGAGEILINVVNKDGTYTGFDTEVAEKFHDLSIPLILAGGARQAKHFADIFSNFNIDALAAGNMFHFIEHSVTKLKTVIDSEVIRTNSHFNYEGHKFQEDQRLEKLDDNILVEMMYEKLEDQKI